MNLDEELNNCYAALCDVIAAACETSRAQGVEPIHARNHRGDPILGPLLTAQAHLLTAIAARENDA